MLSRARALAIWPGLNIDHLTLQVDDLTRDQMRLLGGLVRQGDRPVPLTDAAGHALEDAGYAYRDGPRLCATKAGVAVYVIWTFIDRLRRTDPDACTRVQPTEDSHDE